MTERFRRAALVLPESKVRRDFETALKQGGDLELLVMDPITEGGDEAVLSDVDLLLSFGAFITDKSIAVAKRLRWIQCLGVGVDGLVDRRTLGPGTWVTSARGVHSTSVSEATIAAMLALARDLPRLVKAQQQRRWAAGPAADLLSHRTVGILGVGLIAEALAKRCRAFEMRVEGVSNRPDAAGFDRLWRYEELEKAVAGFDYFVLLAPLSDRTRNIVGSSVLSAMKPTSRLINMARGGLVDEDALLDALQNEKLAAAALDVFSVEPLPEGSPLWSMPNVLISPHCAGQHGGYAGDVVPIVLKNLQAMRDGRFDDLINVVRPGTPS